MTPEELRASLVVLANVDEYPGPERRELVRRYRRAAMARQRPGRCWKHQDRRSVLFAVQEPGRRVRHVWLCLECASVLTGVHGATLRRP